MRFSRPARLSRLCAVTSAVLLSGVLLACSSEDSAPEPAPTTSAAATPPSATSEATPTSRSATTASSPSASATSEERPTTATTSRSATTASSTSSTGVPEDVAKVQKIFAPVAPASLFQQFEACNDSGINNAWECSGPEVGQFQFFQSMSKAASTTQLITELRSSRVVEDTGRVVVGWSTLGTTAVITVVDNEEGLVMQQMVSSDRVDPEERIYELGLAERAVEEPEENADTEA